MEIITKNVLLRKFRQEDAKEISLISRSKSVACEMSDMILEDENAALEWINWTASPEVLSKLTLFAIEKTSTKECIGYVYLHKKPELDDEVELAYAIGDEFQSKGYGSEATKALVDWAFMHTDIPYIVAITKPGNIASQRIVEKLSFCKVDEREVEHNGLLTMFYYYRLDKPT